MRASRAKFGLGTTSPIVNRRTGEISGWKAKLPREHSRAPSSVKNPKDYQEALPGLFPTETEARSFLIAAIQARRENRLVSAGGSFSYFASVELAARLQSAKRKYGNNAKAVKHVSRVNSIDRCWLTRAPWYGWRAAIIGQTDLQSWFDWLANEAVGESGNPLSAASIQAVKGLVESVFTRARIEPSPATNLRIPKPDAPRIDYLDLRQVRRLFASDVIPLAERVMIGCGMGAALRVGELLSIESDDVHIDDHDPHVIIRYGGPHHGPPKGGRIRRVELFEPGLGFWREWMRDHYADGRLVFAGPRGGYQSAWPESFTGWAPTAGREHMTSHIMRHTYAVAMLSGTWGYEPKTMVFVSKQLGHASLSTTERYYAAFEVGVWQKDVRVMTGREPRPTRPVTAQELLGFDASIGASTFANEREKGSRCEKCGAWIGSSP